MVCNQYNKEEKTTLQTVDDVFNENKLQDLASILSRRHCLNRCNLCLGYVFHFVQAAGILTTTVAAGYNEQFRDNETVDERSQSHQKQHLH